MHQVHPDVGEVADGNLFLTRGRHNVFARATSGNPPDIFNLQAFRDNIRRRSSMCHKKNIEYLHVIFPDKQTVLNNLFPDYDIQSVAEEFLKYSGSESILLLTNGLRKAGLESEVFLKLDTHMTDYGNIVATKSIVERVLHGSHQFEIDRAVARLTKKGEYTGDLGGKLSPPRCGHRVMLDPDWTIRTFSNNFSAGNDGIMDFIFSPDASSSKRLVLFGDSFGRACLRVLSLFFREILFIRSRYFHPEIVNQARPDVVITQCVERYLNIVSPDNERPNALLYPLFSDGDYKPPVDFVQVLDAVLSKSFDPSRFDRLISKV